MFTRRTISALTTRTVRVGCWLSIHSWSDAADILSLSNDGRVVRCCRCDTVEEWTTQAPHLYRLAIPRGRIRH